MLLVEARRKMICVANLVHNPLSRGNGSSEKLSSTELSSCHYDGQQRSFRVKITIPRLVSHYGKLLDSWP